MNWHRHRRTLEEVERVVRGYAHRRVKDGPACFEKRNLGVLRLAWNWFRWDHLPLISSPSRMRSAAALRSAQDGGTPRLLAGPAAWLSARRHRRIMP